MFLSQIRAINFRTFGEGPSALNMNFQPGLNVLIGENDSGKSAIMDAIRYTLGTTSQEYIRFQESDFYQNPFAETARATQFFITLKFEDIAIEEASGFVEHLTWDNGNNVLYLTLTATLVKAKNGSWIIKVKTRSGKEGDGPEIDGEVRANLSCTFLKPLRDAENELASGRSSRLSQILLSHSDLEKYKTEILKVLKNTEDQLGGDYYLKYIGEIINDDYLTKISLKHYSLKSRIALVDQNEDEQQKLKQLFEKLELFFSHTKGQELRTKHGLGANNLLFIAAELLLLKNNCRESNPLLLIEEPEAHLHPQAQMQLLDFLVSDIDESIKKTQIIITTHSPNLAYKVPVENLTLVIDGKAYSLSQNETKLDKTDYQFLRKFLDVTKANLFFARGVIIVEGDAENILIPTIARLIGMPLEKYGVSIVNVGHIGLFRYARIFQRKLDEADVIPISVACIADRDLIPDIVGYKDESQKEKFQYVKREENNNKKFDDNFSNTQDLEEYCNKKKRNDGENVKTFLSPKWTLEYDLAFGNEETEEGLCLEVHQAIQLTSKSCNVANKTPPETLSEIEIIEIKEQAETSYKTWGTNGFDCARKAALTYKPLHKKQYSKAEAAYYLAQILEENYKNSPQELKRKLPKYLTDAITFVCSGPQTENPQLDYK